MPDGDAVCGAKLPLEIGAESARSGIDERWRFARHPDAGETAAVEADTAEDRNGAAAHSAASTARGDRDTSLVTTAEHSGNLGRVRRPSDDAGPGRHCTRQRPAK